MQCISVVKPLLKGKPPTARHISKGPVAAPLTVASAKKAHARPVCNATCDTGRAAYILLLYVPKASPGGVCSFGLKMALAPLYTLDPFTFLTYQ